MKKKRNFLLPLLMAIVMMAMSPTKVWADDYTITVLRGSGGYNDNEGHAQLFDGSSSTKWCSDFNENDVYVIFKVSARVYLNGYTLTDGEDTWGYEGRHWDSWTIYGANFSSDASATKDATGWAVVDSQSGQKYTTAPAENAQPTTSFTVSNANSYQYYMVKVTGVGVTSYYRSETGKQQMAEMTCTFAAGCTHTDTNGSSTLGSVTHHDATCTTGSYDSQTCSLCNREVITNQGAIDPTAHDLQAVSENIPTSCTTSGNNAYWTCSRCNKVFADAEGKTETTLANVTIPAGHIHPSDASGYSNGFATCSREGCGATIYQPATKNGNWYEVGNAGQLYWVAANISKINYIRLTNDITVNPQVLKADGTLIDNPGSLKEWTPIYKNNSFDFYGNGHIISGLYVNTESQDNVGLVSYKKGGEIQNLGIIDSYFKGKDNVGGIAGCIDPNSSSGTITNCYFTGTVVGTKNVGGLVGNFDGDLYLSNSYTICNVTGTSNSGGLIGCHLSFLNKGYLKNCYTNASTAFGSTNITPQCVETGVTTAQFASGEIAYKLNGSVGSDGTWTAGTGTPTWYQKLPSTELANSDSSPVFKAAEDGSNTVYCGYVTCIKKYTNVASEVTAEPEHDYSIIAETADTGTGLYTITCSRDVSHVIKVIKDYAPAADGMAKHLAMNVTGEGESTTYSTATTIALSDANQLAGVNISFSAPSAPTYTRTMEGEWGTLVLPFAVSDAPAGFEFYRISSMGADNVLHLSKIMNGVAAGTSVFVRRIGEGTTLSLTASNTTVNTVIATASGTALQGTYAAVELNKTNNPNAYFVYNEKLYSTSKLGDENHVTINPFRAYLMTPVVSGAKQLVFVVEDETTGIGQIENGELKIENSSIYNINGQKLAAPRKGINIINGKKVLVK